MKKWNNEELELLKEGYGAIPLEELCGKLNRSSASVKHKAEREGIVVPRQWTDEEIEYLKNNYKTYTYKQLSEHLNRTKAAIDLKINRLGLVKSQYVYNHDFFEKIETEDQAYWCGFIMADGCVARNPETNSCELCIKLQASDGEHLKKFNKALDGNIPVTFFTNKAILPGKTETFFSRQCQIRLYSEKMVNDISQYGVIPNKSLVKVFPGDIPDNLISHYIRGYFDGNGTICLTGSNPREKKYIICCFATGSEKFAEGLKQKLEQFSIQSSSIYKNLKSNCYNLRISGMRNVDNFLHFIYDNSNIYLDKKFYKKIHLYKITNMEQRLLRQTERSVYSRDESSEKENGKAEIANPSGRL